MAKAQEIQEFINRMKRNERAIAQNKKLSVEKKDKLQSGRKQS